MVDYQSQSAAERHAWIAAGFADRVAGTVDWDAPSPVPQWKARDVVRHLVEWLPSFLANGSGIVLAHGPEVDEDPVGAWKVHAEAVQALLDDPVASAQVMSNPHMGQMPVGQAIDMVYTTDVFLHTWDLARATGQDERLDPVLCQQLYDGMLPMDQVLRASGQYGPKVEVPEDSDVQTKLMAFIGRDPLGR